MKRVADVVRTDHFLGVRFAINVFLGSIVAWIAVYYLTKGSPIWAMAALIASSEPVVGQAAKMFRSTLINTAVGCAVGLAFLTVGDPTPWKIPFALALAILLSTYVVRIPVMWRQAPITAAIVIAASLSGHSEKSGMEAGLMRVLEVLIGAIVGVSMSWIGSRIVPLRELDEPV
jgi:uncharacterized membrane protein YccC